MVFAITSARAGHIHFEKTKTFDQISRQAEMEEKGFFVYFSARWCAPCQMMNKSTFKDENLADYVSERFIPVKMDIDDNYGKLWQDQFNVQAIPTIIFFDQCGYFFCNYPEKPMPFSSFQVENRPQMQFT